MASRRLLLTALVLAAAALAPAVEAQSPTPGFTKSLTPSTIGPGSVSTLRFDITNASGSPVRDLAFTDNLPAGMTIAAAPKASSNCLGTPVLSAPAGGGTIDFSGGGLGASSSCFVRVDVTSSTPGTHTNVSGDLTSDAGNSGSATADLTVAIDRPGFTKGFSPGTVPFGGRSTLTFTIDNSANPSAANSLAFTDTLPSGMAIASPANRSNTCSGGTFSAPAGGSVISYSSTFPASTVGAGATCTLSVDVLGNAIGTLGNTSGELTSTPPAGFPLRSSGKASATLVVVAQRLSLTKTFTDDPVPPGDTVNLRFTIRNLDRAAAATDITFTDDLDATLAGLEAVGLPLANPCGAGSELSGTDLLTLTGGNLPAEGSCTFDVTLQVPAAAAPGAYPNTTSTVTGDAGGTAIGGAAASDVLFVEATPRLTKEFTDDPVGAGGSVTLEFVLTNTSPDQAAADLAFEDVFDVILPTASATPAPDFCGAGSTATFIPAAGNSAARLVVSGASLAAGASCTFSLVLDVAVDAAGGNYPNTTSGVTGTVGGAEVTGDPATDTLAVVAAPELTKEFVDDPVVAGDPVTLRFTLEHDENAAGDATGITFTDDLDAALSGLVSTSGTLTDVCGIGSSISGTMTLTFSGGSLGPGELCSFDVTLATPTAAAAGPYTNLTSIVVADVLGVEATSRQADDVLRIAGLTASKEFTDDPVIPGDTVNLRFTLENVTAGDSATAIAFTDDLDDVIAGMTALGLPLTDPCGTGSSLTGSAGNSLLTFQGGNLAAGASCTFDVTVQVPVGTLADTYTNRTSNVTATFDGSTVVFERATDELEVVTDLIDLDKEFIDDPASPGGTVTLRFTVVNLSDTDALTDLQFSDDLDTALSGLASVSGTLTDVCGVGSQLTGSGLLSLTGGSLAADGSCSFDVLLEVPAEVPLGTVAVNTTSEPKGLLDGLGVQGAAASDTLRIDSLSFSKSFSGAVFPGDPVTLTFSIANLSLSQGVTDLSFTDDLAGVLAGLEAVGLPASGVCGASSEIEGVSFLAFSGGSLLPGGSCSFSVDLEVPAGADPGSYLNVTSELQQAGVRAAAPASTVLTVLEVVDTDADDDGVNDEDDICPGTVIPEGVPTDGLRPNRYALVDGDLLFDTVVPPGGGPGDVFTTTDTAGCSCEQIIDAAGLGNGHRKHGCSVGAMRNWVDSVSAIGSMRGVRVLTRR